MRLKKAEADRGWCETAKGQFGFVEEGGISEVMWKYRELKEAQWKREDKFIKDMDKKIEDVKQGKNVELKEHSSPTGFRMFDELLEGNGALQDQEDLFIN